MNIYRIFTPEELLKDNSYVGRGIIVGKTPDKKKAVFAYFIMGRSVNSRNRVFALRDNILYTEPFDKSKVQDPSLIIYAAVRKYKNHVIVTNGDQTDTIYEGFKAKKTFSESLSSRCFEPDPPNFTPRISALLSFDKNDFSYKMSILKSIDEIGSDCARYEFSYPAVAGMGHFIHTYLHDGDPIPTFTGEPERIAIDNSIDVFAKALWENLDKDNKISLYVRYIDLSDMKEEDRLINKNI